MLSLKNPPLSQNKSHDRLLLPAIALFFLGIATRLPFQGQIVWGDAGNFALAVEHYDVRLEQPQMPGMFVVFIFAARFFNLFLNNTTASLTTVNVVASGIAAAMLYVVGTTWFNPRVGWATALLMLTSPLIWFNGEMALSHMAEFAWVVLIDWAAYRTGIGDRQSLFGLGILMGLAGGIRPSTPFFLLPLALFAAWRGWQTRSYKLRDVAIAVFLGIGAIALWMIPLIVTSGGWQPYWQMVIEWLPLHTQRQDADSLIKILDNIILLFKAVLRTVGIGIIPLIWMGIKMRGKLISYLKRNWAAKAIALSILPGMLFFLLVHLRRKAHSLTIMPGFILLGGLAIVALSDRLRLGKRKAWIGLTAIIVTLNGLFFLLGPAELPTLREIRNFDAKFSEPIAFIEANFEPQTTAVLTHPFHKRLVAVYLPQYQDPHLSHRLLTEKTITLTSPINTLVILDHKLFRRLEQQKFQTLPMPSGKNIRYLTWSFDRQLQVTEDSLTIIPRQVEK